MALGSALKETVPKRDIFGAEVCPAPSALNQSVLIAGLPDPNLDHF